jgi:hypothetical protein
MDKNKDHQELSQNNTESIHRTAFANVVEGFLIYNFRIYCFCRTVQLFGETRSQSRVDRLENSTAAL